MNRERVLPIKIGRAAISTTYHYTSTYMNTIVKSRRNKNIFNSFLRYFLQYRFEQRIAKANNKENIVRSNFSTIFEEQIRPFNNYAILDEALSIYKLVKNRRGASHLLFFKQRSFMEGMVEYYQITFMSDSLSMLQGVLDFAFIPNTLTTSRYITLKKKALSSQVSVPSEDSEVLHEILNSIDEKIRKGLTDKTLLKMITFIIKEIYTNKDIENAETEKKFDILLGLFYNKFKEDLEKHTIILPIFLNYLIKTIKKVIVPSDKEDDRETRKGRG